MIERSSFRVLRDALLRVEELEVLGVSSTKIGFKSTEAIFGVDTIIEGKLNYGDNIGFTPIGLNAEILNTSTHMTHDLTIGPFNSVRLKYID